MAKYDFTIQLTADCEAGSGFGSELLNSLVPRDHNRIPYIPASHLKGLMRDRFRLLSGNVWPDTAAQIEDALFGRAGQAGDDGQSGRFRLTAASNKTVKTGHISRTALGGYGVADAHTLRTTEMIAVGTTFAGSLEVDGGHDDWPSVAARLALLSVMTIGGNRNRGAGACFVKLQGRPESPGALLKSLAALARSGCTWDGKPVVAENTASTVQFSGERVFVKLRFEAKSAICCPETPVVEGNNVISSGFAIPASAVQGALLTRLNAVDSALATACFESRAFRVWPLHPVSSAGEMAYRVSATHKIGKLPNTDGTYTCVDLFLKDADWRESASGSPLKGSDGVLMQSKESAVRLWRSSDMPRIVTGHAVHHDPEKNRNLFTVESMAPLTFVGLAALPKEAVSQLKAVFAKDNTVVFGKARTIRGEGLLSIEELPISEILYPEKHTLGHRVFILQSPVAVPESLLNKGLCAEKVIEQIVTDAGWGRVEKASASLGVRFGWNRHGKGRNVGDSRRLEAVPVVSPGSVFKLQIPVDNLPERLAVGLGDLKEQGFGAVLPHPGEAGNRFEGVRPPLITLEGGGDSSREGWKLYQDADGRLTPSQIAALASRVAFGVEAARMYIDNQIRQRPKAISDKWKPLENKLRDIVARPDALAVLTVWKNLARADKVNKEVK